MRWELIESSHEHEVTAAVSKIKCSRISEQNHTLVEWSAEYSNDASSSFLAYEKRSFEENLVEIRSKLTGTQLPILYHVPEAPSTRVIWLCSELAIPIRIKEATPSPSPDLRRSSSSVPVDKGGLITSFVEGETVIYESGAIVFYLLEKYDHLKRLSPPIGTIDRATFLKFFFHISSTLDNIVFDAYKYTYVIDEEGINSELVVQNYKDQWDQHIVNEFLNIFKDQSFICGNIFSACDIMMGWTLFMANLLGWLDSYPILKAYLNRISKRSGFQKAFPSY